MSAGQARWPDLRLDRHRTRILSRDLQPFLPLRNQSEAPASTRQRMGRHQIPNHWPIGPHASVPTISTHLEKEQTAQIAQREVWPLGTGQL